MPEQKGYRKDFMPFLKFKDEILTAFLKQYFCGRGMYKLPKLQISQIESVQISNFMSTQKGVVLKH